VALALDEMAVQLDADGSGLLLALHAGAAPGEAGHAAGEPVRLRCCRDSATGEAGGGFRWARADGSGSGGGRFDARQVLRGGYYIREKGWRGGY
jgi:hypothetical protein